MAGNLLADWHQAREDGNPVMLAEMQAFLTASDVVRVPMPTTLYERACRIRAFHNYSW